MLDAEDDGIPDFFPFFHGLLSVGFIERAVVYELGFGGGRSIMGLHRDGKKITLIPCFPPKFCS